MHGNSSKRGNFQHDDENLSVTCGWIFYFVLDVFCDHFLVIWYGTGVIVGSFAGWTVAYLRLRWIEKHMDVHVFCVGDLIPRGKGKRPSGKVFDRRLGISEIQRKENT